MRESRSSGSVEGVMGNHDSYSDSLPDRANGLRTLVLSRPSKPVLQNLVNVWQLYRPIGLPANPRRGDGVFGDRRQ